jgi:sec-independent protein translocase protein TatA
MLPHIGVGELIIILLIVVVLFGAGRVGRLGGELGTAIREFRRGLGAGEEESKNKSEEVPDQTTKQS